MAAAASFLVDSTAYIDTESSTNDSTAHEITSNGNLIEVSLWPARPPIPSRLSVHGLRLHQDEDFFEKPSIVCTAGCYFILDVAIGRGPPPRYMTHEMNDYFIYRPASSTGPSLKLLRNPHPHFNFPRDGEVGILPRGDQFTIAVLSQPLYFKFTVHLFKSEVWDWTSKDVLVDPPQIPFPMPIPANDGRRHFQHVTDSVITVGGAIGWVDLWRGILLYDVLRDDDDKIHFVPLPARPRTHTGEEYDCCPKPYRSVAVVGDCLKLVQLEVSGDRLPGKDPETRGPRLRIDNWALTTYTISNITNARREDWKIDRTVNASGIGIDRTMLSALLRCGMLRKTQNNSEAADRNLQNLWICQPVLGPNDDEGTVVYLIARVKFMHPKAWVLAIDMKNNQVQAMATVETERSTAKSLSYFPCRISSPST